ncbi:hypothetical protein JXA31_06845 [Candidatus Bathyarchaeota archaeon]|nr:hypothetical protein [Candidatus Bathyarchaeota archaeon]
MRNKFRKLSLVVAFVLVVYYFAAFNGLSSIEAEPTVSIRLYRDNAYGFGNDISGLLTVRTEVSTDVTRVEFYLDTLLQSNCTTSPFNWSFDTNNYTLGLHTIKVVAYDALGDEASAEIQRNFIEFPTLLILSIIVATVVITFAGIVIGIFRARKREAKEKHISMRR